LIRKSLIFILTILSFGVNSQQLKFKYLDNENGLSSLYVSAIAQDDKGFMWFGTQDGLNKYDGYQIKVYKSDPDSPDNSLSSNEIYCIKQISSTLTAIGTREGVTLFYPLKDQFVSLKKNKLINGKINVISHLSDAEILAGGDDGLFKLNLTSKAATKLNFGVEKIPVITCILAHDDYFLIGTKNLGLWKLKSGKLVRVDLKRDDITKVKIENLDAITTLIEYAKRVYIGTAGTGIYKFDPQDGTIEENIKFKNTEGVDGANFIESMQAINSKLYVATNNGFYIYDLIKKESSVTQKSQDNTQKNGLLGNNLKAVLVDKEGNLWIGTAINGIHISFKQSQKFPQEPYFTNFKEIYVFASGNKNELLIGGNFKLTFLNPQTKAITDISNIIGKNTAGALDCCVMTEAQNKPKNFLDLSLPAPLFR
jgi:hypothetical protein